MNITTQEPKSVRVWEEEDEGKRQTEGDEDLRRSRVVGLQEGSTKLMPVEKLGEGE
jgi:hypothetical protein